MALATTTIRRVDGTSERVGCDFGVIAAR